MVITIAPIPEKSPLTDKQFIIQVDWLRWLRDITTFLLRILNKYDTTKAGVTTLVTGTKVIANTSVKATSYIRMTVQAIGGTSGFLSIVLNPGVGFTINSSSALDTSTIFYEIVEAF